MPADDILVGLAAGDMLGAPLELLSPVRIRALHGEVSGPVARSHGVFQPGEFTDDTQLTLCLLQAYPADARLVARATQACLGWIAAGPRDVGNLTRAALETDGVAAWRESGRAACGNGAVMRAAASVAAGRRGEALLEEAILLGAITHADPRSLVACAVLCAGLRALLDGERYADAWRGAMSEVERLDIARVVERLHGDGYPDEVGARRDEAMALVRAAIASALEGRGGGNSGFAVSTLQTAVAHGAARTFAEGVLPVVREGDDADTVGAVTGAILGARGLLPPAEWLADLRCGDPFPAWPWDDRGPAAVERLRAACARASGAALREESARRASPLASAADASPLSSDPADRS